MSFATFLDYSNIKKESEVQNIELTNSASALKRNGACVSDQSILGFNYSIKNNQLILIGKASLKKDTDKASSPNCELFGVVITVCNNKVKHSVLDKNHIVNLLSHEYSSILTCLCISKLEFSTNFNEETSPTVDLSASSSQIFAATSQRHLLEFSSGKLLRCVDISSSSISDIQVIYGHLSEKHISLFSMADKLFTGIRCEDLQIKETTENVEVMCVDDFTDSGTDQVLLIHSPTIWPPTLWLLTDLGPTWQKYPAESRSESLVEPTSSLQAAVQALQTRLQTDIVNLEGVKSDCFERADLIGVACDTVRSLTLDQDPSLKIHYDLALLCGQTHPGISPNQQSPICSDWLEVKDTWQRFFDGRWVIGVELLNTSNRELVSLSLNTCLPSHVGLEKNNQMSRSVWPINTAPQSINQSVRPTGQSANQSDDHVDDWVNHPSSSKRRRVEDETCHISPTGRLYPGQKTSILCVMSQPLFGVQSMDKLLLFLSFLISPIRDGEPIQTTSRNKMNLFIGRIECSLEDMFDPAKLINLRRPKSNHQFGEEKRRDRLTVDVCQDCVELTLQSTQTNVALVTSVLLHNDFTYQPTFSCYLFPDRYENCRCVRIELIKQEETPKILLFTRDKSQLWLVLHILYSILPDDVLMVPWGDGNDGAHNFFSFQNALKKELASTVTSLSDLLRSEVKDHDVIAIDCDKPTGAPSVRDTFTKMQADLQDKRIPGVISDKVYQTTLQCIEKAQKTSDSSLIQLRNKTS